MERPRWPLPLVFLLFIATTSLAQQIGNRPETKPAQKQLAPAEFERWLRNAEKGKSQAQVRVGQLYETGDGVQKDDRAAAEWYRKAALQDDPMGQTQLGAMYENGKGVPQDYKEAMKWYRRAAESKYSRSNGKLYGELNVGRMYEEGRGLEPDYVEAVKWYRLAADPGWDKIQTKLAAARLALGRMYERGLGVSQDYAKAANWYQKAADNPPPVARQVVILSLTFGGWFAPPIAGEFDVLTNNDVRASSNCALGTLYERGLGVREDYSEALKRYHKAIEFGSADAEENIARMYDKGRGLEQSHEQAMNWHVRAAQHGSATAQIELGSMYEGGKGVQKDYVEAASWYRKAAVREHSAGEYFLGSLLYTKLNNPMEGIEWLRKSAAQGDERARQKLAELNVPTIEVSEKLPRAMLANYAGALNVDPPFTVLLNGNPEPALTLTKGEEGEGFILLGPQDASSGVQSGANRLQIVTKATKDNLLLWKEEKLNFLKRPPFSHSYAIIIAISRYQNSGYPDAEGTVPLAKLVAARLEAQGFEPRTFFDEQATAEAIDSYIRNELVPKLTRNDRVIFYFCGHGDTEQGPNGKDVGYLVTYGVSRTSVRSRALPMRRLRDEYSDLLVAKHVLFLLDACFSGLSFLETTPTEEQIRQQKLAKYREIEMLASGGVRAILTAGRKQDRAINANGGLFTRKFLDAISGSADYDGNGVVTLEELYCYLATTVRQAAASEGYEQEPQIDRPSDYGSGSFLFLYR